MTLEAIQALEASRSVKIDKYYGHNFTEYTLTGDLNHVLAELKDLFIQYHPYSYGSRLQKMEMLDDGAYRAIFWRGNSGD